MNQEKITQVIVAAKAAALREAAIELLSDESAPPKSMKEMYNAIYSAWLEERATHIEGRALVQAIHERNAQ